MTKYAPIDMEALALDTLKTAERVAKAVHGVEPLRPVMVSECWRCAGIRYEDNGDRCYVCSGTGRVASDGGEI